MRAYRAPAKPAGSIIEEVDEWGEPRFRWRLPTGGPGRFFAAAFLAFWLCGWAVGWVTVTGMLLGGGQEPPSVKLFLIAWLGGWTIGGGAAIWYAVAHRMAEWVESLGRTRRG